MERIGKIYRSTVEKDFKDKLSSTNSLFIVKYSGLKAAELSEFRSSLSRIKSKVFVTKNSLARRVLKEADLENLTNLVDGQAAVIFAYDDPISLCKAISNFAKNHAALEFAGGILERRLVNKGDLTSLVSMPSKEQLRAKLVSCMKAPINNFVFVLSGCLRNPINVLNAIKNKKEKEGGK